MPIIKSAMKRVRQQAKRQSRNLAAKRRIKASTKTTLQAVASNDLAAAKDALTQAISQIDKAVKKGTLHKNTGARRKSALTRSYNSASDTAFGTEARTQKKAAKPAVKKPTAKKAPTKKSPAK